MTQDMTIMVNGPMSRKRAGQTLDQLFRDDHAPDPPMDIFSLSGSKNYGELRRDSGGSAGIPVDWSVTAP